MKSLEQDRKMESDGYHLICRRGEDSLRRKHEQRSRSGEDENYVIARSGLGQWGHVSKDPEVWQDLHGCSHPTAFSRIPCSYDTGYEFSFASNPHLYEI